MKKNILFVMNNLRVGGAEKALIAKLEVFDYSKYNVDLQLFTHEGLFLKQLTDKVNLLPPLDEYSYFDMSWSTAAAKAVRKGRLDILLNRLKAGWVYKTEKNASRREQRAWQYISPGIRRSGKKYDAAIGFLEKMPDYYVAEKVDAKIKVAYIHNDYDGLQMDPEIDRKYFPEFDYIVTDSEECKNILSRHFPQDSYKVRILMNIVSPKLIRKLAEEEVPEKFSQKPLIISVGRIEPQKGYHLSVEALKLLKDRAVEFHWVILGKGVLEEKIRHMVQEAGLDEYVSFLGIKENHYAYVSKAAVYMQTSIFEGKSVAVDEAKILGKPILITEFPSVRDQIENGVTGIVVKKVAEEIAGALERMLREPALREGLSRNLAAKDWGTEHEMEKFYQMLEGKL